MKINRRILSMTVAVALGVTAPMHASAEDIDLFVSAAATTATNPNILIILDNSANWNSNAQHWPAPSGETGPFKQGESELRAIKTILNELDASNPKVNLGLMMMGDGAPDGGFLRYGIRTMDKTGRDGFVELIGERSGCSGSNSVNGTPNCVLQNFSGPSEQTNTASTDYSGALFDAYKYFGGFTSPAFAQKDLQPPGAINDRTHHKLDVYFGNGGSSRTDLASYTTSSFTTYKSPITNPCAKNYVIFIGNGHPNQDGAGPLIANVNGGTSPLLPAQLAVPNFTTITSTVTEDIGTYTACASNATCVAAAQAAAPGLYDSYSCTGGTNSNVTLGTDTACKTSVQCALDAAVSFPGFSGYSCSGGVGTGDTFTYNVCSSATTCPAAGPSVFPGYDSYSCATDGSPCGSGGGKTGRTMTGTVAGCLVGQRKNQTIQALDASITPACLSPNRVNQTMRGTKTVSTVTPLTTFSAPNTVNYADEWARLLYTTDVSELPGQQNVTTYAIDVFKDQQDADETALLFNMAKFGGGRYFQASNEQAIVNALRQIMIEVQSVNSVFASASLPINATNRSQNENQVFIGMFRPDGAGNPRWYGNLKRYQIAQFGQEFKLADASTPPLEAVSTTSGFIQPCAKSFWTEDSGDYWLFQNGSAGQCTSAATNIFSDAPDGPQVEKGAVAEVLRRGNNPPTTPGALTATVNRNMYTCMDSATCCTAPATCGASPANELVPFNTTNVSKTQLGSAAMSDLERDNIVNFTKGQDLFDNNANANATEVRPSIHGDVAHSRPLPVNYGGTTGVVLFYGANDGTLRAVRGSDGKELWAFIAPEHHAKLKRLTDNSPPILYPNQDPVPVGATTKDYFFDGSAGLYQNADNSKVWLFPSMRRGGRMIYAFDVTVPDGPVMKWRVGCPNQSDDTGCTTGFANIGQTWATPSVALIRGHSATDPVVVSAGGYDECEDKDAAATVCSGPKGSSVFAINADTGALLKEFTGLTRSAASDVTFVDRDFDGYADHAYVSDTGGGLYRIDFIDPATLAPRASSAWTITKLAQTTASGNRKFLFQPGALAAAGKVFITVGSGDRERPLIVNYPYVESVQNRFYMFVDSFATTGLPVNLDDPTKMDNFTDSNSCSTTMSAGSNGWFIDLNNGRGEQTVTFSTITGGLAFFSTNRPVPTAVGACANNLGEARGYALNLLNASGAADTLSICGGQRSAIFAGGGLPPSPVIGTVPVGNQVVTIMVGGVQRGGGVSTTIGAQRVTPTITQRRSRIYWYTDGDK